MALRAPVTAVRRGSKRPRNDLARSLNLAHPEAGPPSWMALKGCGALRCRRAPACLQANLDAQRQRMTRQWGDRGPLAAIPFWY
jgi:hypothetical protein